MAQLNTRIVLRNDSSVNWLANESIVLLKGEVGIEFLDSGKVMMKIGDGVKTWGELSYFGGASEANVLEVIPTETETHADAIARITQEVEIHVGDVVIINDDERIAHIYNGSNWLAMSNEYLDDIADVQSQITELTKTVQTNTNELALVKEGVQSQTNELALVKETIQTHTTELTTVKETVQTQSQTLTEVQTKVDTVFKDNVLDVYTKSETYNRLEVENLIAAVDHLKRKTVVSVESIDLNASDAEQYIYMVLNDYGTYDEYMVLGGSLERVGDWKIDLSDYAKTEDVNKKIALLATKDELTTKADKSTSLAGYGITDAYTKNETYTRQEIADLIADITGGESAADVLAELNTYKGTNDAAIEALRSKDTAFESRIAALEEVEAQANVLEAINFNGQDIAIIDKKATFSYNLPIATSEILGGVKSSDNMNKVSIDAEGNMEVNSLNVNKLVQTDGDTLILNGGSAQV